MSRQRGMTLVELMVSMAIGLGIVLAVTTMLIASQDHKRATTSTNDAQQSGAYGFYALDKVIRSAGSSIGDTAYPSDIGVLGCHLNSGAGLFPRGSAFPAPFANFLGGAASTLNVAPVLIGYNQSSGGSDVLMVMGGSGAAGGVPRQITGGGGTNYVTLDNIVGFAANDLLLVSQSGTPDCLLEQVSTLATPTLNMGGTYYTAGTPTALSTFAASTSSYVTPLGNANANNVQFFLYGVDATRTLYSYDLLQNLRVVGGSGGDVAQTVADGVQQLSALYGIDSNGDAVQDYWATPSAAGSWDIVTVMNSPAKMKQILSVRIALIVRGQYYEKDPVSPGTLTIFSGMTDNGGASLARTITLSLDDQHYRYRTFEFTVPLRNMILQAGGP